MMVHREHYISYDDFRMDDSSRKVCKTEDKIACAVDSKNWTSYLGYTEFELKPLQN